MYQKNKLIIYYILLEVKEARRLSEADIRAQAMKESLEIRLAAVKDVYDQKFEQLEKENKNINTPLRNSLASYFFELYAVRVKSLLVEEATTT